MADERPSPFTISAPAMRFVEGPPAEQTPFGPTVGALIHNLTEFATFYEQATADIERADPFERQYHRAGRDANADWYQRCFRATPGIELMRSYVLAHYGADLTIGTARRVLGDLIRHCQLTVEAAESLTLDEAADRLSAASMPAANVPPGSTQPRLTDILAAVREREEEEFAARELAIRILGRQILNPQPPAPRQGGGHESDAIASATPKEPEPNTPNDRPELPLKKTKGKHIDAKMLKLLLQNNEAANWSAARWAQTLGCAESTVKETDTWNNRIKVARALLAADAARKMDRGRLVRADRPHRVRDDVPDDDGADD